jgi:hypothetical protein
LEKAKEREGKQVEREKKKKKKKKKKNKRKEEKELKTLTFGRCIMKATFTQHPIQHSPYSLLSHIHVYNWPISILSFISRLPVGEKYKNSRKEREERRN